MEWGFCVSRAPSSVFDPSFMCQMRTLYSRGHGLARTTASLQLPFPLCLLCIASSYSPAPAVPRQARPATVRQTRLGNHMPAADSELRSARHSPCFLSDTVPGSLCINLIGLDAMRTDPGNGWLAAVSMSVSAHEHQAIPGAIWPGAEKSTSGRRRQHAGTATGPLSGHCKRCAAGIRRARLWAGVLIDDQFPSSRRQPLNHFSLHILIM